MKTIVLNIQKGGVGKTSLSVSLAAELAKETGNVLLIDADPQGSATNWIGQKDIPSELSDVLFGKADLKTAITKTNTEGLFLLPTAGQGGGLNLYAKTLANQQDRCIKKITRETAASFGYRFCIIDMSPAFGALEWACFIAADEVITPVLPDSFAADGLATFADNLAQFRSDKETDKPFYKRIIINSIDHRIPQHEKTLETIKQGNKGFLLYEFPVDPAFRKSQAAGITIRELQGAKKETLSELNRLSLDIIKEV
ncbi:MAG: ParA family protein [Termitinemataceae bacterium]|nr:MAG: ParA family protein [Termitinemataceae bacterium]